MPDLKDVAILRGIEYTQGSGTRETTPEEDRGNLTAYLQLDIDDPQEDAEEPREVRVGLHTTATHPRGIVVATSTATFTVPAIHGGLADDPEQVRDLANRVAVRELFAYNRALLATLGSLILNARVFIPPLPEAFTFTEEDVEETGDA